MKKMFTLLAIALVFIATAQKQVQLISSTSNETVIEINASNFNLQNVNTPNGTETVLKSDNATEIQKLGAPDLAKFSEPIIIPNDQKMAFEIIDAEYEDIPNVHIAPSKGVISRNINPETVAYQYGEEYSQNKFFPENLASLSEPFIMRDVRGISVRMYPYQYNPITKTLRVYSKLKIRVYATGQTDNVNVLVEKKGKTAIQEDFAKVYSQFFLNSETNEKYTPLDEGTPGRMLVICYASFMSEMQAFVDWKNQKGILTEMVDIASIGNSASAIKSYVQTYKNDHSDFAYLLLVGDNAQVTSSSTSAGVSDNDYGYLSGSDHYVDIFVGRFSAETASQVTTQVERTIHYEKDITASETWMQNALGVASDEGGSGGDDGETDIQHLDNIKSDLNTYGYNTISSVYQGTGATATDISTHINNGVGLINYCGHGDTQMWYSVDPSGYTNSHVDGLTNTSQLPFIFTVACVVGDFANNTCFGEAWQRATDNSGNPTGAIANIASTINQSWASPMCAQDEMDDVLVESYSNNIKRTFGGLAACGWGQMIDEYGSDGNNMTDTWTVFGDASIMVRTKQPTEMTISHASGINLGATSFNVSCNEEDALVSITKDNVILGTAYASGGSANVSLSPAVSGTGTLLVTVTAFNKVTYQQTIDIIQSANPPLCDFSGTPLSILEGESVSFTDLSTEYPNTWDWTFGDGSTNATIQNPTHTYTTAGTYTVTLYVANGSGNDTETKTAYVTVNENTNAPTADFIASATALNVGESINFTDLSTDNPTSWYWEFEGGTPATSTAQNPTGITYNAAGTYQVKLTASNSNGSDIETKTTYITVTNANFSLDFEACVNYSNDFTPWQSVDNDGLATYSSSDCDFPNEGGAFGFMAFNPADAGFSLASTHGGDRCGMAICPSDASASDNWIISAQLNLGVNTSFSFWVLTPKPGTWGNESFNVLVSTTGNNLTDFTAIATDIEAPSSWTQVTYDLSAYDNQQIYVAIQHVAVDKFMFWVDDIEINSETFTAVNNIITDDLFTVYPNPNNGSFTIKTNVNEENIIKISDITGKIVWETQTSMDIIDVNLIGLNKGIYFVNVSNENNVQVEKIIIK